MHLLRVELQVRLIEEKDKLGLLLVAYFGQLLEQLDHQPKQERCVKLWRLMQLVRCEDINRAFALRIDLD